MTGSTCFEPFDGGEYLLVEIEDSGTGFDVESLDGRHGSADEVRRARGLQLVRSVCTELRFEQRRRRRVAAIIALCAGR